MSLLGIDLGTTGCKAGAFSLDGVCIAQAYCEYDILHPQSGWSELDSGDVWIKTKEVIAAVSAQVASDPVTALSISAFGEAFVPVSKDREVLGQSILCVDDRGQEYVDRLIECFGSKKFYSINPNIPGPNYTLPKLLWFREHRYEIYDQADYFLLWSDFIAFMLGGEAVANNSHANHTLLFDLKKNDWSDELLAWSGIPREKLGRIVSCGTLIGKVNDKMAQDLGLPGMVNIVAGGHDQCCNALGCGCGEYSAGKAVYGLGSFDCITPVFKMPDDPLMMFKAGLTIEHHVLPDLYAGFIYNQSGLLVKWFRDTFAADTVSPAGIDIYTLLDRELPEEPTSLLVLPHFEPPISPHHIMGSSGVIAGLKTSTTRGEILKAIRECATLYFVESVDILQRIGIDTTEFIASGGGAKSDKGLQTRADVFGVSFVRPCITEASLLGAAMLAGISTGTFKTADEAISLFVKRDRVFEPDAKRHELYCEKYELYQKLYPALKPVLEKL